MFGLGNVAFDDLYFRNGIRLAYTGIDSFAPDMNFAKIKIMFMVKLFLNSYLINSDEKK